MKSGEFGRDPPPPPGAGVCQAGARHVESLLAPSKPALPNDQFF